MTLEWLDTYQIDQALVHTTGAPQYPVIAWNTMEFGGWVAEVEKVDNFDALLPWQVEAVKFGRGARATRLECYTARRAAVAILASKTKWFDRATGERLPDYREGAYSRLQLLALVKDGGNTPYLLTTKGVAAGLLAKALTAVRRGPIAAGRRASGKELAEAAFWLTIYAAPTLAVGKDQTTEIVPPAVEMPGKGEDPLQWLGARYIGSELLAAVNGLAEEAATWAVSDAGGGNGHGGQQGAAPLAAASNAGHGWDEPDDAFPPDYAPDDPFDALPSASREPAQAQALATAGKDLFWNLARGQRREGAADVAMMAKAAEMTGDWSMAIAWLQGPA